MVVEAVAGAPEVAAAAGFVGELAGEAAAADVADVACRSAEGGGRFAELVGVVVWPWVQQQRAAIGIDSCCDLAAVAHLVAPWRAYLDSSHCFLNGSHYLLVATPVG